jgi:hypothetical protein
LFKATAIINAYRHCSHIAKRITSSTIDCLLPDDAKKISALSCKKNENENRIPENAGRRVV